MLQRRQRLLAIVCKLGPRRGETDTPHRVAEELTVLGLVDGLGLGPDHLHAKGCQDALLVQGQCCVECRLAAHGRQQCVRPLLLDDFGDDLGRDGLDIGCIGQLRIGHDRSRVGVDQNDAIALGLERLAGLSAGIVELAGLTDDNGTRADDEDGLDICALRHGRASYCTATGMAIAGGPNPRSAHRRYAFHGRVTRQPFFWAPWRRDSQGSGRSARGVKITTSAAGLPSGSPGT